MQLNSWNTQMTELRAAWQRDWNRLVAANVQTGGIVRHLYSDRPEDVDPQIWEAWVRKDYENSADWFALEPLETEAIVSLQ
jgi:hypothetical protein